MIPDEMAAKLEYLLDRQAIDDCLMTYSRAMDRLDRELLLSVYHEDATDDHGVFVGSPVEFADWAMGLHTNTHLSTQHCQFNSTVELEGDVAHSETYYMFVGMNRSGKPMAMAGGRYLDRLEKREGCWKIASRICIRDWAPVDAIPERLDQASLTSVPLSDALAALIRSGAQPARDRTDPSYIRPLPARRASSSVSKQAE